MSNADKIIEYCRKKTGLTVMELSEKTGIAYTTIRKYEQGLIDPTYGKIEQILKACGCRLYVDRRTDDEDTGR